MDVKYINPFIESVCHVFSTMLGTEAKRGDVGLAEGCSDPRAVTALIGLSGPARGTVAITFAVNTALGIASHLLGTEVRTVDETVSDAVGELVNIVAGGAKALLNEATGGEPIRLSLPTVIRGSSYSVDYPSQSKWLDVPFTSDIGPFSLRVTFEFNSKKGGNE